MPLSPAQFRESNPSCFFLDPSDPEAIDQYLRTRGVLGSGDRVRAASKAGDGNMNCTLRVTTGACSFIVKQSRPWVEKYPQFEAPWDRACVEAEFYQLVSTSRSAAGRMPRLIDFNPLARVLVLEDLGEAADYSSLYRGDTISGQEIAVLAGFLSELHGTFGEASAATALRNHAMRELNHAHIFVIPLAQDNGIALDAITPGLAAAAQTLKSDEAFCRGAASLGRSAYLAEGRCLVHGDFFPGSVLRTPGGPKVIDPEFGHFGRAEWDVAVFLAHLLVSGQTPKQWRAWLDAYAAPSGFDEELMLKLAGVEVMRRLLGYAQLPINHGIERKTLLLELSRNLVLQPGMSLLADPSY